MDLQTLALPPEGNAAHPYPFYAHESGKFEKLMQRLPSRKALRSGVDKRAAHAVCPEPPNSFYETHIPLALTALAPLLITGCMTGGGAGGPYHVVAYKPHNPANVRVDLSKSKEQVYVMEGDRCLMAAACNVGLPRETHPERAL